MDLPEPVEREHPLIPHGYLPGLSPKDGMVTVGLHPEDREVARTRTQAHADSEDEANGTMGPGTAVPAAGRRAARADRPMGSRPRWRGSRSRASA